MRALLACIVAASAFLASPSERALAPRSADAAVSIAYTLEKLVADSRAAVVARAVEQRSEWAHVAGSRRIVTLTRLAIDEAIDGDASGELWVRTLGGVVDRIGQQVSGEATLVRGERAVLFLTRTTDGVWVVTGMGQGHYPVRAVGDGPIEKLVPSPQVGRLVKERAGGPVAAERLVGRTIPEAVAAIRAARSGAHAPKR